MKEKGTLLVVQDASISVIKINEQDFISISDMANNFGGTGIIEHWLRNRDTIEFLGIWEKINNENFNSPEFEGIRNSSGSNRFTISVKKWVSATNAIGLISKAGRYGGTYAHKDIAFEFGSWLSPEFKLYLIKEFQRLKELEQRTDKKEWNVKRELSKINYKIHTDAIKDRLIPPALPKREQGFIYAEEADVLNVALFGITAKEWRDSNPDKDGNIRDYASTEQLLVLANLESHNAIMIHEGISQPERLAKLNKIAIIQMNSLLNRSVTKRLIEDKT